jgi:hypothetical protein
MHFKEFISAWKYKSMDHTSMPVKGNIILPTAYNPPLSYMMVMMYHNCFQIDIHETYPKQTWRNRCRILTANGILDLSIPVEKPVHDPPFTGNIVTSNHLHWQRNHWRSICSAYRNSPYFIYYADLFETRYLSPYFGRLIDWNNTLLANLIEELKIGCTFSNTISFTKEPFGPYDYRLYLTPKKPFDLFKWPTYHQVFSEKYDFFPDLSIIDLMFNLGPDSGEYLQECVQLFKSQLIDG